MHTAIIGLGYVGLPLSLQFARSGVKILGLDIDPAKVKKLNAGESYIKHIASESILAQIKSKQFEASTDFSRIREVEAVIICVPTPLNKNREPDISYILDTGRAIAPHLRKGTLVVLESTTYPGTTEEDLRAVLEMGGNVEDGSWKMEDGRAKTEDGSPNPAPSSAICHLPSPLEMEDGSSKTEDGSPDPHLPSPISHLPSPLRAGIDFHLAYSPEREDPGNPDSRVADIPKLVGGLTPACCEKAVALYRRAIKTVIPMSSCRAAEAAKLLENIFRSVNIALVNELKVVYTAMGIDIWEVINAAKTKPFGFMPFYPGPGLGGHCIPIDPFYLTWKAREYGQQTRFIELAGQINTAMPEYIVHRVAEALNQQRKAINGSKILLLGLAYKANVDDMRQSATFHLLDLLQERGAAVAYYDPHIPVIGPTREHSNWAGRLSVEWNQKTIASFDLALIATAHAAVNYRELAEWSPCIVDTRNAMAGVAVKAGQVWKA